jgi:hypothetical protein
MAGTLDLQTPEGRTREISDQYGYREIMSSMVMQGRNSGKCGRCFGVALEKVIGLAPNSYGASCPLGNDMMENESGLGTQSHLIPLVLRLTRWDEAAPGKRLDRSAKYQVDAFTEEIVWTVVGVR